MGKTGRSVVALLVIVAFATAGALSAASAAVVEAKSEPGRTFVGKVEGTGAYIAIVVGKNSAIAYICDGDQLAQWLRGSEENGVVALADTAAGPAGGTLLALIDGKKLTGSWFRGDEELEFSARRARGDAGLYREEQVVDGVPYAAGWVQQRDGSFKGQVTVTRLADPTADTSATTVPPTTVATQPVQADIGSIAPPVVVAEFPAAPPPDAKLATAPADSSLPTGEEVVGPSRTTVTTSPVVPLSCTGLQQIMDGINKSLTELGGTRKQRKANKNQIEGLYETYVRTSINFQQQGCGEAGPAVRV